MNRLRRLWHDFNYELDCNATGQAWSVITWLIICLALGAMAFWPWF